MVIHLCGCLCSLNHALALQLCFCFLTQHQLQKPYRFLRHVIDKELTSLKIASLNRTKSCKQGKQLHVTIRCFCSTVQQSIQVVRVSSASCCVVRSLKHDDDGDDVDCGDDGWECSSPLRCAVNCFQIRHSRRSSVPYIQRYTLVSSLYVTS